MQLYSSEWSRQSFRPSHLAFLLTHEPLAHSNSSARHRAIWKRKKKCCLIEKKIKMCINKIRERKKKIGWINRKKYAQHKYPHWRYDSTFTQRYLDLVKSFYSLSVQSNWRAVDSSFIDYCRNLNELLKHIQFTRYQ